MKKQLSDKSPGKVKKGNAGKSLSIACLGLEIITTAVVIICLRMFLLASSSRPSTPAEIAAQMKFQDKWNTAQKEFYQKVEGTSIDTLKN
ncbi:MAG TPA: hypothetical protein VK590_12250 [Saprospiraceae bacterium]|nr:hypothetical protein [Saprospiraceae bacterium]